MNFGQIKTAVYSALGDAGEDVSIFDFGEALNSAQIQLCSMLPLEAATELMVTMFIDPSGAVVSEGSVQLPPMFYSLEFVQFATERAGDGSVVRNTARIVSPEEFELLTAYGTVEQIASATSQLVRLSPSPTGAGNPGDPKSIKMVYKARPRPYMGASRLTPNGSFVTLLQHNDSPHLFTVRDYFPATDPITNDILGIESENDLLRGRVFIGPPQDGEEENIPVYEGTVVDAYYDTSQLIIVVSEDDAVPPAVDESGTRSMAPSLLLPRQSVETGTSMLNDEDVPDFTEKWHPHLVDLSVARILISLNEFNAAAARLQLLNQKFQTMGLDVFFTIPEGTAEKGGK